MPAGGDSLTSIAVVTMNPKRLLLFSIALWSISSFTGGARLGEAAPPIRIMPLGDSITYGTSSTGTVGYRRPLYQFLVGAGYSVDFVGSQTNGSPADFNGLHGLHRDRVFAPPENPSLLPRGSATAIRLEVGRVPEPGRPLDRPPDVLLCR